MLKRCLLAYFEATLYFSRSEFTCRNINEILLLWSNLIAEWCSFPDNLTLLGVTFILLAMEHDWFAWLVYL